MEANFTGQGKETIGGIDHGQRPGVFTLEDLPQGRMNESTFLREAKHVGEMEGRRELGVEPFGLNITSHFLQND
jgi:hypothetical protein